jgi:hypothetical protein
MTYTSKLQAVAKLRNRIYLKKQTARQGGEVFLRKNIIIKTINEEKWRMPKVCLS